MMNQSSNEKKGIFISIQVKMLVIFTLVFTIVFAGVYYWFFQYSTDAAMARVSQDLSNTLNGAIAGIDGDEFKAFVEESGYNEFADIPQEKRTDGLPFPLDNDYYIKHQAWLETVHQIEPKATPYTFVKGFEKIENEEGELRDEILFVGDYLRIGQPDIQSKFFESYGSVNMVKEGLAGEYEVPYLYTDKWGAWKTAYAPIYDSQGEVVGGLGVDFRADDVIKIQNEIISKVIQSFLIAYIILLAGIFVVNRSLTKPIVNLTRVAEKVGEGDYEQDFSSLKKDNFRDEIDTLSDVFTIMVNKIHHREQNLKKQVEQLKIEIDEAKRSKQVDEIVDTDFFRDLQEKANKIRSRRSQPSKKE